MKAYRTAGRMKTILFVIAIGIILAALVYTQSLVGELRKEARNFLNFYADVYAKAASDFQGEDYSFIFEQIIQRISFPVIISSEKDANPTAWKNIGIPPSAGGEDVIDKVTKRLKKMDKSTNPIPLTFNDIILGYIHYGDSRLIRKLQWYPVIEILVVALFILIGYMGYQTIRKSEQRSLFVGMARETAHQLGTPISSLLGWIELLQEQSPESQPQDIIQEMKRDVSRLERIAARFSQIGSRAKLRESSLGEVVGEVTQYIRRRLPQYGKAVSLEISIPPELTLPVNVELLSWALENLIKNGIDAIDKKSGQILIYGKELGEEIQLDIIDSGHGIQNQTDRKNIFKPGFSTKKRGWGLGLSLAKRIVEEYHEGRLELVISSSDEGTHMRVTLNREKLQLLHKRQ